VAINMGRHSGESRGVIEGHKEAAMQVEVSAAKTLVDRIAGNRSGKTYL
jgi:hypothetical protein